METADCMVVGFKQMLYKPGQADSDREFFDEKQSFVRRKIAAVEVYFDLLPDPTLMATLSLMTILSISRKRKLWKKGGPLIFGPIYSDRKSVV